MLKIEIYSESRDVVTDIMESRHSQTFEFTQDLPDFIASTGTDYAVFVFDGQSLSDYILREYRDAAKASQDAAKVSEDAAKQSEDNAKSSEVASKASQEAAARLAMNADQSAQDAAQSATAAQEFEGRALTHYTNTLALKNQTESMRNAAEDFMSAADRSAMKAELKASESEQHATDSLMQAERAQLIVDNFATKSEWDGDMRVTGDYYSGDGKIASETHVDDRLQAIFSSDIGEIIEALRKVIADNPDLADLLTSINEKVDRSGDSMDGPLYVPKVGYSGDLDVQGIKFSLLGNVSLKNEPTQEAHAVTKKYADSKFPISGGTMAGNLLVRPTTAGLYGLRLFVNSEYANLQGGNILGDETDQKMSITGFGQPLTYFNISTDKDDTATINNSPIVTMANLPSWSELGFGNINISTLGSSHRLGNLYVDTNADGSITFSVEV